MKIKNKEKKRQITKITSYSIKGGQGKTTIAALLALEFEWPLITNDIHSPLHRILPEDSFIKLKLDQQLPSAKYIDDGALIFDFGGYLDPRIIPGLQVSDLVIIPVSNFGDILDTEGLFSTIAEVEVYNKNIMIVLNRMKEEEANNVRAALKKEKYPYHIFELRSSRAIETAWKEKKPLSQIVKNGGLLGWRYAGINNDFEKIINYIKGEI